MKYVISWTNRPNMGIEDADKALRVFTKWAPDPSVTFHQFVQRVDGLGGYAVVETENGGALLHDALTFSSWFDFKCEPVIEMLEAAPIQTAVTEHVLSLIN